MYVTLDPDPNKPKILDPDPNSMYLDPQQWQHWYIPLSWLNS